MGVTAPPCFDGASSERRRADTDAGTLPLPLHTLISERFAYFWEAAFLSNVVWDVSRAQQRVCDGQYDLALRAAPGVIHEWTMMCVLSCWRCTLWKVFFLAFPVYVLVQLPRNLLAENFRTVLIPAVPAARAS